MKNIYRYMISCCAIVAVVLLFTGCSKSRESFDRVELEQEFEGQFGFAPNQNAFEIRCKLVNIGDTVTQWLSFRCDREFVQRIAGRGFIKISEGGIYRAAIPDVKMANPNAPSWWKSMKDCGTQDLYYIYAPYKTGAEMLQNQFRYFWWDDASGTVYYCNRVWR
jgi:hypothetical protein